MKLLVIGNRVPWPLHDGGAIATYGMLRSLAENGAEVHFFTFNTKKHFAEIATIEKYFGFCKVYLQPLDAGVRVGKALLNLLTGGSYHMERYDDGRAALALGELMDSEGFDVVLVEGLYSVPVYLRAVPARRYNTPAAYRAHNLEHQIWARLATATANPLKKWYLQLQAKRLQKFEQRIWSTFQAIVPIVKTDAHVIKQYLEGIKSTSQTAPITLFHTYQPGIAIERPFAFIHKPLSLFHIGSMEWQANEQGVIWFLQKVWPLLLVKYPQAKFHLAGKGLSKSDPRFFQTGVINHGDSARCRRFYATTWHHDRSHSGRIRHPNQNLGSHGTGCPRSIHHRRSTRIRNHPIPRTHTGRSARRFCPGHRSLARKPCHRPATNHRRPKPM